MEKIQELINDSREYVSKLTEAKSYLRKWESTPLLEDVQDESIRLNYAILLENQAKQLLKEATTTGTNPGNEEWSGLALPIVRRTLDNITIRKLVGFQPLTIPSGLIFYLDFTFGSEKPGYTKGASIYGVTENITNPTGGFYGSGKYAYGSNLQSSSISDVTITSNSINERDIDFDTRFSSLLSGSADENVWKVQFKISNPTLVDFSALDILTFNDDDVIEYPQFTKYNSTTNYVTMIVNVDESTETTAITGGDIYYMRDNKAYDRGDFEAKTDDDIEIPQINMELKSKSIVAKSKKTKAQFTPEVQQDMDRYNAMDAEAELTKILSDRLAMETDLEIYSMLNANADNSNREYWSAVPGVEWNPANSGINKFATVSSYHIPSKKVWYETLEIKIRSLSNKIHQRTLIGGANFIICGTDTATIIESMESFKETRTAERNIKGFGGEKIGILSNRFEVYKVPYFQNNVLLMGYSGQSLLDVGAVWAPYIPLIMSPLVNDAVNFTPRKMIMSRFGKAMIRNDYYGKIYIHGLS